MHIEFITCDNLHIEFCFTVHFNCEMLKLCIGSTSGRSKIKSGIKVDVAKFKGEVENFTSGVFRRVQSYRSNNSDYVPRLEGSLENHPTSGQYPYCSHDRCLLNLLYDYNKKLLLPRSAENAEPY